MDHTSKWTVPRIRALKGERRIAVLTAYDYATARLVDEAGLPAILVGDSLGMTVLGYESTLPVTMEDMLHHTRAVVRGVTSALVVADMPFLSYQVSVEEGIDNAGRLIKNGGADAVKIEGGAFRKPLIEALVANGIPVMGHIGLMPQSVHTMGGYKIQGRDKSQAAQLEKDAVALEAAGVFSIVLEGVPSALGADITRMVAVPTIGIGAGPECDGQVLVLHDLIGLSGDSTPRFVKQYAPLGEKMREAFRAYRAEVESGVFPGPEHSYGSDPDKS
jgi:3-methyl-2-oxobutanoate hydroxymethyltransferase